MSITRNKRITAVTATYTILSSDQFVLADTSSGGFTVTLPSAVGLKGQEFWVLSSGTGTNNLTVEGAGSETINGALNVVINAQYEVVHVISDNANWLELAD